MDKNDKKIKKEENPPVGGEEKEKNRGEIVHLKQEIEELEDRVKRIFADYQNLEKRVAEEKRALILNANKHLLMRLMPVLDTLMLALAHTKDKGLELSIKQFTDTIEAEGVSRIETKDKMFDPLVMECVGTKKGDEMKVLEETRSGYKLGEIVLRPALVIVGSVEQEKNIDEKEKISLY
jgi:molecular chaperone GrpE